MPVKVTTPVAPSMLQILESSLDSKKLTVPVPDPPTVLSVTVCPAVAVDGPISVSGRCAALLTVNVVESSVAGS